MDHKVDVLECTLRDGSYAIDYAFTADDTRKITKALQDCGFKLIEIGHGTGIGSTENGPEPAVESDEAYLAAAAEVIDGSEFGMFFLPEFGRKHHLDMARDYGMSFIRIGTDVTHTANGEEYVKYAKKKGYFVSYNLMKSYGVPPKEFAEIAAKVASWGTDIAVVVDSAGCMLPGEVKAYVEAAKEKVDCLVGFHGHNNLQLAVANILAAVEAGVDSVDTSLRGMGRSAGNAQTEIVIPLLKRMGILKYDIDEFMAMDAGTELVEPLMPPSKGTDPTALVLGLGKFHSSYLPLIKKQAEKFGLDSKRLALAVGEADCVDITEELIVNVATGLTAIMAEKVAGRG
jgi:4-hydroxy-2-oxovalerate aldolase